MPTNPTSPSLKTFPLLVDDQIKLLEKRFALHAPDGQNLGEVVRPYQVLRGTIAGLVAWSTALVTLVASTLPLGSIPSRFIALYAVLVPVPLALAVFCVLIRILMPRARLRASTDSSELFTAEEIRGTLFRRRYEVRVGATVLAILEDDLLRSLRRMTWTLAAPDGQPVAYVVEVARARWRAHRGWTRRADSPPEFEVGPPGGGPAFGRMTVGQPVSTNSTLWQLRLDPELTKSVDPRPLLALLFLQGKWGFVVPPHGAATRRQSFRREPPRACR